MAKYRGVTWNNAGAGPKVKIRRSIWLAELQDFGAVADAAVDLPTAGAVHRAAYGGSKSGTREFVDLSTVNDLAVVDTQDHGLISDATTTFSDWPTMASVGGAITTSYSGVELNADYGLDFNPSNNHLAVAQTDASGWFGNSTGWSIEFWFKHNSSSASTNDALINQHQNIVLISTGGGNGVQWAGYSTATAGYQITSSATISDTDWHHIHVGYDGTTVRMFLDGTNVGSSTTTVHDGLADSDFLIGAREGGVSTGLTNYWDGEMADIHITSGSASHARTANYDVDDIQAPESTDETQLLIYGTLTGWTNTTTTTVTETGGGTAIGYDVAQPWAGYSTSNVKYDGAFSFTSIPNYSTPLKTSHYPHGMHWSPDGTKFYWMMLTCRLVQGTVSTPWDITSTVDIDNAIIDFGSAYTSQVTGGHNSVFTKADGSVANDQSGAFFFDPTGTRVYVYGSGYYTLGQYDLNTAWDVSSGMTWKGGIFSSMTTGATANTGWTKVANGTTYASGGYHWTDNGNKLLVQTGIQTGKIEQYEFSTPYDLTTYTGKTANYEGSYGISGDTDNDGLSDVADVYNLAFGQGIHFNHNGTELYRIHRKFDHANYDGSNSGVGNGLNGSDVILVRATLSTPYDISTMAYASQTDLTDLTQNSTGPTDISPSRAIVAFHPNGKKFWLFSHGASGDSNFAQNDTHIFQYTIG